jgi:very-short-patch-repair endonuclease
MSDPSNRIRGTTTSVDNAAKQLRKTLTPAEQQLWQSLRGGKLAGLKFRRQHPVGNFILDFYCAAHKLVVEVDGGIHETQIEYDAARTTELEAHGCTIMRFANEIVLHQLETVLAEIFQATAPHSVLDTDEPPTPSPKLGRGLGWGQAIVAFLDLELLGSAKLNCQKRHKLVWLNSKSSNDSCNGMESTKRQKLEAAGWKVGSVTEFLQLSPKEAAIIETRLALRKYPTNQPRGTGNPTP